MSGSCHLDRASNDKRLVLNVCPDFFSDMKSDLKVVKMIPFELMHPDNTSNIP